MLETNIRILDPGVELKLTARLINVAGQHITAELLQKACNHLLGRGIPATPRTASSQILALSRSAVASFTIEDEDWHLELTDTGQFEELSFSCHDHRRILTRLSERAVVQTLQRRRDLWSLDSPRIFYEDDPFMESSGIAAYRRYEVSAIPIDGIGVALVSDVGTGFFATETVADFYRGENERDIRRFEQLINRQKGQQGTLVYELGNHRMKCYFSDFMFGQTCATTGTSRIKGVTYSSLQDYYGQKQPHLSIATTDSVAKVSFPNMKLPVPVAAKLIRPRIFNDALPRDLKDVDKVPPAERRALLKVFWQEAAPELLRHHRLSVAETFWAPASTHFFRPPPHELRFGNGGRIYAPVSATAGDFRPYYSQRTRVLGKRKCAVVPPTIPRDLVLAYPRGTDDGAVRQLGDDVAENLRRWTGKPISFLDPIEYPSVDDAIRQLSRMDQSFVLFVFDDASPETYYKVSYDLRDWRLKRVTTKTLAAKYKSRTGAKQRVHSGGRSNVRRNAPPDHLRSWNSFIRLTSLDVLQQLRCLPWTTAGRDHFDARLAIDVGRDKKHFALSLVLTGSLQGGGLPISIDTTVEDKADWKLETINKEILRDEIVKLFCRARRGHPAFERRESVLAVRDGRKCGDELAAISEAMEILKERGIVAKTADVFVTDIRKQTACGIRMWEVEEDGTVENTVEGASLLLDATTLVLQNTGAATLRQGTANPVMFESHDKALDMRKLSEAMHNASQLNFSSPGVAQRLPIELKRTDDELKTRHSQEVRRVH